ncbi:MAG: molybdopterin-dependent oxidoreductase [Desulfomonile tiedjei]|nr:molybdopterin-dependent oxidoreductase [Desulfomonile tiedjei]
MTRITRREFIRLASLMGGASLFAGCTFLGEPPAVPEYIQGAPAVDPVETLPGLSNLYSVCGLCPGNCGICCRIASGTLVKIGGNPYHPISTASPLPFQTLPAEAVKHGASVCAIGGSGIQTLYDPFRVARPLKRVGARGSGKWKAISWKQAMAEIVQGGDLFGEGNVSGLHNLKESGEGLRFLAGRVDWGAMTFIKRFMAAFPGAVLVRDREARLEDLARLASVAAFGPGTGPVSPDYRTASLVISFGDAPIDSGIPLVSVVREIADARVVGPCLKWAVVDPRLSTSASRADLWVPVIPGKDLSLALGIMRALLDRHPAIPGIPDRAFQQSLMARSTADYAQECGVPEERIASLADMLANAGEKAAVFPGRGILAQPNGVETAATILRLNLMVGSVPGSGGLTSRDDRFLEGAYTRIMGQLQYKETPPTTDLRGKALIAWEADPVYDDPEATPAALKNRQENPLFVAIDRQITETSVYADYILPDTTYLERWDVCSFPPSVTAPGVGFRRPVVGEIDPRSGEYFPILREIRPMEEILADLAVNLDLPGFGEKGMGPAGNLKTAWDYYGPLALAVLEGMQKAGFPVSVSATDRERVLQRGGYFPSATEFSGTAKKKPQVMASWKLSAKAAEAPQSAGIVEGEFLLTTYNLPFHRGPRAGINRWLLEVLPENRLIINTVDARKLGIKQRDAVTVATVDGKVQVPCRAHVMPGIRPGVVALARGFGYSQAGAAPQDIDGRIAPPDKTPAAGINAAALISAHGTVKVKKA